MTLTEYYVLTLQVTGFGLSPALRSLLRSTALHLKVSKESPLRLGEPN